MLTGAHTWTAAQTLCEARGQRLASLSTQHLNHGMPQLLQRFADVKFNTVFVGLKTPAFALDNPL